LSSSDPTQYSISSQRSSEVWHTLCARIRKSDISVLNNKLQTSGFKTFNEFVNAWIKGEYPKFENNKQAEKMLVNLREGNFANTTTDEFSHSFYRNVDREDMLNDLLKKYVYKKHAKDLVTSIDTVRFSLQIHN
jgi:hypothetical protein